MNSNWILTLHFHLSKCEKKGTGVGIRKQECVCQWQIKYQRPASKSVISIVELLHNEIKKEEQKKRGKGVGFINETVKSI